MSASNVVPIRDEVWVPLSNGQTRMNPNTLVRMAEAFPGGRRSRPAHVLGIGGAAGTWPTTVYKAMLLGYMIRTEPGMFVPTELFWREVYAARERQRRAG